MGATVRMRYTLLDTELGQIGLVGSGAGLRRIVLPRPAKGTVFKWIMEGYTGAIADRVSFNDELDLADTSLFRRAVWEATRAIPYGQTRSYGEVARRIGKPGASRAVGQALAKNPLPIVVPCHRVIGKDGDLTGFEGGLELKKSLLQMEATSRY